MQFTLRNGLFFLGLALFSVPAWETLAEEPSADAPEIRYRMPALILCTSCEWPEEPELHGQMSEFVKANGFNCIEADLSSLDVCRENGLYARLGDERETTLTLTRDFEAIEQMNKSTGAWISAGAASEEGQTTLDLALPAGSGELFRLH